MRAVLVFILTLNFFPVSSQAATFEVVNNDECLLWLRGPIVPGDFETLYATIHANGLTPEEFSLGEVNYHIGLCLDSPGGAAFEGQLIAEYVHSIGMPTRVPAEAECFSACAIIFMAGRNLGGEFDGPLRELSTLGIVGFHAPFPVLKPGEVLTESEVMELFDAYRILVANMMKFGGNNTDYSSKPTMSISLLEDLFSMAPEEFKTIETVEDALLWNVTLIDIPEKVVVDSEMRDAACKHFLSWTVDQRVSEMSFNTERKPWKTNAEVYGSVTPFEVFDHGRDAPILCLAEIVDVPVKGILICTDDGHRGVHYGDCRATEYGTAHWVPWYSGVKANTPIQDLKNWQ